MGFLILVVVIPLLTLYVVWARREMRVATLMSYLATTSGRGYPLGDSLTTFAETASGAFAGALRDIASQLSSGASLSAGIRLHRWLMPDDMAELIESGEASGRLSEVFRVLAQRGCRSHSRRMKILGLSLYPFMLLMGALATGTLLAVIIAPKFQEVMGSFDTNLPVLFYIGPKIWGISLLAAAGFLIYLLLVGTPSPNWARRSHGWGVVDAVKWWLPGARQVERYEGMRLFAQALAIELSGGVPLRAALRRATEIRVHRGVGRRLEAMYRSVERGEPLSRAAGACGLFPGRFVHMLAIGEQGGNLVPVLDEIVARSDDACDAVVSWISTGIIPGVVLSVGFGTLALTLGYFLCIVKLMEQLASIW
jgi:type II secretory pathway component PulF